MPIRTKTNRQEKTNTTVKRISLAPLTPPEAMAAALQIKPADMKKAEAEAKAAKKAKK